MAIVAAQGWESITTYVGATAPFVGCSIGKNTPKIGPIGGGWDPLQIWSPFNERRMNKTGAIERLVGPCRMHRTQPGKPAHRCWRRRGWSARRGGPKNGSRRARAAKRAIVGRIKAVGETARQGRAIFWPQASLRRAHETMLASRSSDLLTLARAALRPAIRSESDLIELLSPDAVAMSALPRRTDVVSTTSYVD